MENNQSFGKRAEDAVLKGFPCTVSVILDGVGIDALFFSRDGIPFAVDLKTKGHGNKKQRRDYNYPIFVEGWEIALPKNVFVVDCEPTCGGGFNEFVKVGKEALSNLTRQFGEMYVPKEVRLSKAMKADVIKKYSGLLIETQRTGSETFLWVKDFLEKVKKAPLTIYNTDAIVEDIIGMSEGLITQKSNFVNIIKGTGDVYKNYDKISSPDDILEALCIYEETGKKGLVSFLKRK